jgi:hypothetical protein
MLSLFESLSLANMHASTPDQSSLRRSDGQMGQKDGRLAPFDSLLEQDKKNSPLSESNKGPSDDNQQLQSDALNQLS